MADVMTTKFVFVTGGVLSGLGKGITAASIGNLLKARGLSVNIQKCDPYLNVDAGTLNPREHGECFVTIDGAETDLDLGHYERFIDQELTQASSLMSGRVLLNVIEAERAGKYEGRSVQIIPHVTQAISRYITAAGKGYDVHIVEIGGTVGDYESLAFIEAIRELGMQVGRENCLYVHVVYMPYLGASQEIKTKPAQNSVRDDPGGEVETAQKIASLWLADNALIMQEKRGTTVVDSYRATGNDPLKGMPTVVLVNAGSASASEITALALHDNKAATIIGEKSYGKGVVQQVLPFSDGSELKVTIANWYAPGGESINKKGITPDTVVKLSDDDRKAGHDPQLAAALQKLATSN